MSTCRSCGDAVVFVPSAKSGKQMILDAKPAKGVVLVGTAEGSEPCEELWRAGGAAFHDGPAACVVDVYTDHHATCPQAEEWRR